MTTDGGGWLVILSRTGGKRVFNKPWKKYQKGFGVLDRDFWLGLDAMHELTTLAFTELRVDLQHWNGTEIFLSLQVVVKAFQTFTVHLPLGQQMSHL